MKKAALSVITLLFAGAVALAQAPATAPAQPRGGGQPPMPPGANPNSQYRLGPDSLPQEGVPKGEIRGPFTLPSNAYPGTQHTYWVYVPAQYDPAVPAALMVLSGWPGFQRRIRRHSCAERDGQFDLSPRNSGDDRRVHQSRTHA